MKGEFSVIVHNRMPRICTTLETDDDICLFGQHIRDLAFSFVTPVSSYNCFYHFFIPPNYSAPAGDG